MCHVLLTGRKLCDMIKSSTQERMIPLQQNIYAALLFAMLTSAAPKPPPPPKEPHPEGETQQSAEPITS
jgi:hypothetical protein